VTVAIVASVVFVGLVLLNAHTALMRHRNATRQDARRLMSEASHRDALHPDGDACDRRDA